MLPAVLAFIDQIVIPFLNGLYGAVGYLGVFIAMTIESAMIPLPSELILPYAGFLVSDPAKLWRSARIRQTPSTPKGPACISVRKINCKSADFPALFLPTNAE